MAGQRTFVIVPAESRAVYEVKEEFFADALSKLGINAGKADVEGSTQEISGQLELNLDDLSAPLGSNSFTVQMNTLETNQRSRDNWIRTDSGGPNFNQYPEATFVANAIEGAPATYSEGDEVSFKLLGDLTVRGVTKPVTFDVTAALNGDTLTGVARTNALISDFGIEPPSFVNTLTVADELGIRVEFTARARSRQQISVRRKSGNNGRGRKQQHHVAVSCLFRCFRFFCVPKSLLGCDGRSHGPLGASAAQETGG